MTEAVLRPAGGEDAEGIAEVNPASRRAAAMPPGVHPDHEVRAWLAGRLGVDDVWVAEVDGTIVGYARFTETWLDDLYVTPGSQGQGIGTMLLDLVKAVRPGGFSLWVFERNTPAQAFYTRNGLVEREHTDGSGNEERAPDLRMEWVSQRSVGGSP